MSNPIFFQISGAITSYIIILVQFNLASQRADVYKNNSTIFTHLFSALNSTHLLVTNQEQGS